MLMNPISIRLAAIALVLASLAACSTPHYQPPITSGSEDKAAESANRDALKNFSDGKAPAWESQNFSEKPNSAQTGEGKHHD